MRCKWDDGQGISGEGNEVIAGQVGVAVSEASGELAMAGKHAENNMKQGVCRCEV